MSQKLLNSFLTNRKQYISINRFQTTQLHVKCGVPQSSILVPLLFLLYINDFRFSIHDTTISHLAEDTWIIFDSKKKKTMKTILNHELKLCTEWLKTNRLSLCHIINMSFSKGIFPEKQKIVKVIPLHKGGSTQDFNNFRPTSLLSIFDKIIEKIIHKKIYNFLDLHNILFENQFCFRKNNSTSYALMEITEKIRESIVSGKFGYGIFIDLRKAFDTVNHDILLKKLGHYGDSGVLLEWFRSYLTDRKKAAFFITVNLLI